MGLRHLLLTIFVTALIFAQNSDGTNPQKPKIWSEDNVNNLPEFRRITSPIKPYIQEQQGGNQQIPTPIPLPKERSNIVPPKSVIERWKVENRQTFHAPKENLYVKGELVIQFNEKGRSELKIEKLTNSNIVTGILAVDELNRKYGGVEMTRVIKDEDLPPKGREFRLDLIYLLKVEEVLDLEKIAREYRAIAEVKGCSPNYYGYKCNAAKTYPNDTYFDWAPNITQDRKLGHSRPAALLTRLRFST